jgi:hypothetical protein
VDVLLKAASSIHPILLNNPFRHQASNDPDCPPLTVFPNGSLIWRSRRGLMSGPIAHPCSLLLGGPGDDIRIFVGLGTQDIDVVGVGKMHGKSVPFHLKDGAWLTLTGKKK